MISYALSMIPPWREALERGRSTFSRPAARCISSISAIGAGLPGPFRTGLRRWLAAFDVTPRDDLGAALEALSAERGLTCEIETRFRGYAVLAVVAAGAEPGDSARSDARACAPTLRISASPNAREQGEDQEPDQSADQRAVDADILQVLADLQLEAVDERGGVPMVDHSGDIGADFRPAGQNGAQRQESRAAG